MCNYKYYFYFETVAGEIFSKKEKFDFDFVDLEKVFGRVPKDVVYWALRKLIVKEWLVS